MNTLQITKNPGVESKFDSYPDGAKNRINQLRHLILEVAEQSDHVTKVEETLKWGEPSYVTKTGSTIRIDWKSKAPDQYAIYFNCNTNLVETFKIIYGSTFSYEKNRAIVLDINQKIPVEELKVCVETALCYHLLKDKPLLGL